MRLHRTLYAFVPVLVGLLLFSSVGRTLGQDGDGTPTPPSAAGIVSGIGHSVGSMLGALVTPRVTPIALDVFPGVEQTRGSDGAFILGDPDAPITLIEFADWGCPHCDAYKPVIDQFIQTYVVTGQAAFEFRMLPTAGGRLTVLAGNLAECADYQHPGAFWAISEELYRLALNGQYTATALKDLPKRLPVDDPSLLDRCAGTVPQVSIDSEYATMLGVGATPAIMVRHGDETPTFIQRGGITYNSGGVPFDVLQYIMEGGDGGNLL